MAPMKILVILYYCYPLTLYLVLSISLIIDRYRQSKLFGARVHGEKQSYANVIWWMQFFLSICLLSSVGIAIPQFISSMGRKNEFQLSQASLISYVTTLLYFIAGLLPDPEGPFRPSPSHCHAWATATIFEAVISIVTRTPIERTTEVAQWSIGLVRLSTLFCMCIVYLPKRGGRKDVEETEGLLQESSSNTTYGSTNGNSNTSKSKNLSTSLKGGWLDYFVGFRVLFPYIWPSRDWKQQVNLLVCLCLMVAQRITNILVPYQLEILIASLGSGKIPYQAIVLYVLFRGLQGQQGVLGSIRGILWIPVSQNLFRRLTCAAFQHIMTLSLDFHLSKRIGEVMSALSKGSALNTFLDSFAFQLFPMVFDLGVAAVYLLIRFDAFYSLVLIGVMWSYIYMTIYMAQWRGRARREMALKDREMDAAKMDTMMSYETVHHNGALDQEANKFGGHVGTYQRAEFSVLFSLNILNVAQNMILTLGVLLVVLLSSFQISNGIQTVATFVSILAYFTQLQAPLQFFGSFYNQVQNNLIDAERLLALFKEKPTIVDAEDASDLSHCYGKIEFINVSFAFDERKPAIENISFTVDPGTKTAIVGESGSGKSSCLKLLFRFYDVSGGSIQVDGHDIRNLKMLSYREHIAVVPQDSVLFNTSILYNLQYAKPHATLEEIYQACQAASIHDRILRFPEKYETKVGERGLRLSGGEKQRVAIARALLKDPQIMLLDEATASLDSHTEKQIQGALEYATKGRTTITIAHRLSTIVNADQILVFHQGQIVERGTHQQLIAKKARYYGMWEKQTKSGSEDELRGSVE